MMRMIEDSLNDKDVAQGKGKGKSKAPRSLLLSE